MVTNSHHANKDIAYHDVIATEYDDVIVAPRAYANDVLFAPISRRIGQNEAMLDIGCGTGHMTLRYGSRFKRVVAVDHSEGMLAKAKENANRAALGNATFHKGDAQSFLAEQPDETYNLVTCVGFLHHLLPEQIDVMLSSAARVLRPNGMLVVAEPIEVPPEDVPPAIDKWNRKSIAASLDYSRHPEEPDEAPIEPALLRSAIEKAQLKIVIEKRAWEVFPHHQPPRSVDKIVMRGLNWIYGSNGMVLAIGAEKPAN